MLEPPDPSRREFTIGRVLSQAWRGFRRRFVIVTAICLAGGAAGALAARLAATSDATSLFFAWQWLSRELIQVAVTTCIATPAILLLLRVHAGQPAAIGEVTSWAGRRCLVVAAGQVIVDAIIVIPTYFLFTNTLLRSIPVLILIAAVQEAVLLAFNSVFMPALAMGPRGPLHALGATFGLARSNWLRLLIIGVLISLFAGAIVAATNYAALLPFGWASVQAWTFDYLLLVQLAQGLGFGIRLTIFVSIATATYHLLHRAKYGGAPGEMARVFD